MSKPTHLPALSCVAKPGTPVSTPQDSVPRFLMASTVGPGQLTPCACAAYAGTSNAAASVAARMPRRSICLMAIDPLLSSMRRLAEARPGGNTQLRNAKFAIGGGLSAADTRPHNATPRGKPMRFYTARGAITALLFFLVHAAQAAEI